MTLISNASIIGVNGKCPFIAGGGTPPYTYSVMPGGAGGSINSAGLYTAPSTIQTNPQLQTDVVRAVDSMSVEATANISVLLPMQMVCKIIERELSLESDQCMIYNQKFKIPNDERMYIAVGLLTSKPFGSSSRPNPVTGGLNQIQSINVRDVIFVNIMSRSTEALNRKEEVLMAVNSVYAQQVMLANAFQWSLLTQSFVNISNVDGSAIPYAFNISMGLTYFKQKTSSVPYFDDFSDVDVEIDT